MYYPFIELGLYYQLGAKKRCLIQEADQISSSILTLFTIELNLKNLHILGVQYLKTPK
jgi:hypothetical protein